MINNQKNKSKEGNHEEQGANLNSREMMNTSNTFLGQMGQEQEGKTESFQGNWAGNYGDGITRTSGDEQSSGDFTSQASNIGNGLTSDEDDLLASGQDIDDLGLGNSIGNTSGKEGESIDQEGAKNGKGNDNKQSGVDASAEGSIIPHPDGAKDQSETSVEGKRKDIIGNEGPGLATAGDFASMTGQNIDDLDLPTDADVAGWRQDAGTLGQGSDGKRVVDDGQDDSLNATSSEFTTGKADKQGG